MSMELAFLVIDRAPLRGTKYDALLYLAMKASEFDFVCTSARALALGMRMGEYRARLALKSLEAAGYILRMRYGASQNPHSGYYAVRRETLMGLPKVDARVRKFGERSAAQWRRDLKEASPRVTKERDRRLEQWRLLPDRDKKAGADLFFFDPEKVMRAEVQAGVQRLVTLMDDAPSSTSMPRRVRH